MLIVNDVDDPFTETNELLFAFIQSPARCLETSSIWIHRILNVIALTQEEQRLGLIHILQLKEHEKTQ